LISSSTPSCLTAVLGAFATICAAFTSFLANEAAAEGGKTCFKATSVFFLSYNDLLWWALLVLHRRWALLVVSLRLSVLLWWVSAAVALLWVGRALLIVSLIRHCDGVDVLNPNLCIQ